MSSSLRTFSELLCDEVYVSPTETGEGMVLEVAALADETLSGLEWFALVHARYAGSGKSYPSLNRCSNSLICSGENE